MFKTNWSKWVSLHVYYCNFRNYVILARKNNKNGKIQFKTVSINDDIVNNVINCDDLNFKDTFPKFLND